MNLPMSFGNSSKAKQSTKKAKVVMSIQLKAKPSTSDAPTSAPTASPWESAENPAEDSSDADSDSANEQDNDRRLPDGSEAQEAGEGGDVASGSADDEDDDAYDDDADEDPLGLPMRHSIVLKVCACVCARACACVRACVHACVRVRARARVRACARARVALVPDAILANETDVSSLPTGAYEAVLGAGPRSGWLALLHGELRLPGKTLGLQRDERHPAVLPSV